MSKAIDRAREVLEARLDELGAERRQVELALKQLSRRELTSAGLLGSGSAKRSAVHASKPRRSSSIRKRIPRAEREAQLMELARKEPAASNAALAKSLDVTPAYVSMLLKELINSGRVKRVGGKLKISA